jgi:hypothetical protein
MISQRTSSWRITFAFPNESLKCKGKKYLVMNVSSLWCCAAGGIIISLDNFDDQEDVPPLECGFDPNRSAGLPFSLLF